MRSLTLVFAYVIAFPSAFAADESKYESQAMKCDYQAMRNHAYSLEKNASSAPKRLKSACMWRAAILMSGSKNVDASDIGNYEFTCSKVDFGDKASLVSFEAQQLVRKICK